MNFLKRLQTTASKYEAKEIIKEAGFTDEYIFDEGGYTGPLSQEDALELKNLYHKRWVYGDLLHHEIGMTPEAMIEWQRKMRG